MDASFGKEKFIVFVRHGESEKNVINLVTSEVVEKYPLTQNGEEQAKSAGKKLKVLTKIDSFYTSPILRARQSADIISKSIGLTPVVDFRLKERNFGILEGALEPEGVEWRFDRRNEIEPWEKLKDEMMSFMQQSSGRVVVAVTHGDNMSAACDAIDGLGERKHATSPPANCHFTIIDMKRMSVVKKDAIEMPDELRWYVQ